MTHTALIEAIRAAWSGETASEPDSWSASNPAAGHCDVSSLVFRDAVGGDLKMAQVFRNGELSEHHYWNVLPDGEELDLTESQFTGDETFGEATHMDASFFAAAGPMKPTLVHRLELFRAAVARHKSATHRGR